MVRHNRIQPQLWLLQPPIRTEFIRGYGVSADRVGAYTLAGLSPTRLLEREGQVVLAVEPDLDARPVPTF